MRSFACIWLSLTQLAILAGCSGRLPLDINGSAPDHMGLPVEFAGRGVVDMGSAAGAAAAGGRYPGTGGTGVSGVRPSRTPVCGDAVIEPPAEACDGNNLNGADCPSLGFNGGGVLLCNPQTCNYNTISCRVRVGPVAGSGGRTPDFDFGADGGTDDAG